MAIKNVTNLLYIVTEIVFTDHKRTVNRIQFHPYEKDLLLSGSQDGTMKYFVSTYSVYSFILCIYVSYVRLGWAMEI